jgi:hypothetical protein
LDRIAAAERSTRLLASAAVACLGLAALAPRPVMAADIIKDPNTIACPSAPSGWVDPRDANRRVWNPLTDTQLGGTAVNVICDYYTTDGSRSLIVNVTYALPQDPNPINDFYFGCGSQGTRWTAADRAYRLTSKDQWAIAAFYDYTGQISDNEVPAFETIARQLLQNARGYGHECSVALKPTDLPATFIFSFQVSAGTASGTFLTKSPPAENGPVGVVQVSVPNIALTVKVNGERHPITIRVRHGLDYHAARPASAGKLRLAVDVVGSKVPSCHKGATGTLTVTTAPSVLLEVCGQSFLHGKARTHIAML